MEATIAVERTHDGRFRVVELSRDGFLVLGVYDDEMIAECKAEWLRGQK